MLRTLASSALLLALALFSLPAHADELGVLVSQLKPAVVHLEMRSADGKASATGFLLSPDGMIATNNHVIRDEEQITAIFEDGSRHEVLGWLARDESLDLAIVKIAGGPYPVLRLGSAAKLAQGTPVAILGGPLGFSFSFSEGIVSAVRPDGLPAEMKKDAEWAPPSSLLQVTADVAHGSSGSPVVTADGTVVGVAQSMMPEGNVNFAVFAERVEEMRAGIHAGAPVHPFSDESVLRNLLISALLVGGAAGLFNLSMRRKARRQQAARQRAFRA